MNDVLDVCRYVINYSNERGYGISNLKLQKILYFIQAYFLITEDTSCFSDKIEAWNFGPVVPRAYREYKGFGAGNIPLITSYLEKVEADNPWSIRSIPFEESCIPSRDRDRINEVVDLFGRYSSTELLNLTQDQKPWINAYQTGRNREISINEIKEYFSCENV